VEELPAGHIISKDSHERAAGARARKLGALLGGPEQQRRMPYPGAPRSMVGASWLDVDDQLPPYVVTLSRYPRLYTTRGGRLVPAVWPRRTFAHPRLHEYRNRTQTATTTTAATTTTTLDNRSTTTPLPPITATASGTASTTETTTTSTRTTELSTTTTTDGGKDEQRERMAAAVHDTRQLAASSSDQGKVSLDVGPPEIGESVNTRHH